MASVVSRLYPVLDNMQPVAAVFLGDTNTTTGALAAAQLNIPVVHIEGCMRSYDWRMPEEKYRTTIDHLADVIYTYFDEYKEQGVREGLNPANIVVVGNPIVDILNHYYYSRKAKFDAMATPAFFESRGLEKGKFYLMTCHRRENVHIPASLRAIFDLIGHAPHPVYFPASYRTQKVMKETGLEVPKTTRVVDPIGYDEMLCLMVNSRGVITDSGYGRRRDLCPAGALLADAEVDRTAASLRRRFERQVRSGGAGEISLSRGVPQARVAVGKDMDPHAGRRPIV